MTDFDISSSKFGLSLSEFSHLSDTDKKKLIRLMARIMERAYRRGVHQTLHLFQNNRIDDWILRNPHMYRYSKNLDKSIGLDGFITCSIDRLMMEEHLENIGV